MNRDNGRHAERGDVKQAPSARMPEWPSPNLSQTDERLAERCEKHGDRLTREALDGYDNMRVGKESLRVMLQEAANAFTIAAALRARTASSTREA